MPGQTDPHNFTYWLHLDALAAFAILYSVSKSHLLWFALFFNIKMWYHQEFLVKLQIDVTVISQTCHILISLWRPCDIRLLTGKIISWSEPINDESFRSVRLAFDCLSICRHFPIRNSLKDNLELTSSIILCWTIHRESLFIPYLVPWLLFPTVYLLP